MWSGGPAGICTRVSVSHVAFVTDEAAGPSQASFSESFLLHGGLEMKQLDRGGRWQETRRCGGRMQTHCGESDKASA